MYFGFGHFIRLAGYCTPDIMAFERKSPYSESELITKHSLNKVIKQSWERMIKNMNKERQIQLIKKKSNNLWLCWKWSFNCLNNWFYPGGIRSLCLFFHRFFSLILFLLWFAWWHLILTSNCLSFLFRLRLYALNYTMAIRILDEYADRNK